MVEKRPGVGAIQTELESTLAMSFWGLSRTNWFVWLPSSGLQCCGGQGTPWPLDGASKVHLQLKNPANIHEEAAFFISTDRRESVLLPIFKNNSKQATEILIQERASSSGITECESFQFAGTCSRSVTRLSQTTHKPPRGFIMALGIQWQAEEKSFLKFFRHLFHQNQKKKNLCSWSKLSVDSPYHKYVNDFFSIRWLLG